MISDDISMRVNDAITLAIMAGTYCSNGSVQEAIRHYRMAMMTMERAMKEIEDNGLTDTYSEIYLDCPFRIGIWNSKIERLQSGTYIF